MRYRPVRPASVFISTVTRQAMESLINKRALSWLLLLVAIMAAGCGQRTAADQKRQVAVLQAPAVGDYYAAELTYFSDADFERSGRAFGLMKVVAVEGDEVTLVTENAASTDRNMALEDLQGNIAGIDFDDSERIVIAKSELLDAHAAGKIFAVRR
ncbi:hypothetical protein [Pseudoxanthomonas putridarboris]|uniref:Uncharacterized protein n=1 Tax=Pseudoxanthomonas putridarboris TaxID=752605 RepID=A0ABU9IZA6_9GAMM